MAGKGDSRRKGANDAAFLKNCPFPSLLERRKAREQEACVPNSKEYHTQKTNDTKEVRHG